MSHLNFHESSVSGWARIAFHMLVILISSGGSVLAAMSLSGTKSIGPTGDYVSIRSAIADIQVNGVNGPLILELQVSYVSSSETFPITFTNLAGASATNTITLRPAGDASNISTVSADTTAATIDLNNIAFLTIDGRPGGAGTVSQLTIASTDTAGVALRFINDASSNFIRYVTLKGVNTSVASGVVVFGTTTGANGNDNNTLDRCDIRGGASTPTNVIYSQGTTTTPAQNNSNNAVLNCNIFNFYAATAIDCSGVRLDGGNTGWTIAA